MCTSILNCARDLPRSTVVKTASLLFAGALVHPIFLVAGVAYAVWDKTKLIHELAIIFFRLWYKTPDLQDYENKSLSCGVILHSLAKKHTSFWTPRCVSGIHYTSPTFTLPNGATLYLSALPLKIHALWLKQNNCKSVISMIEPHEYIAPKYLIGNIVQPEKWKKYDIRHHSCPSKDRSPVPLSTINKATSIATKALSRGKSVCIHCRAGQGRCAAVAARVLLTLNIASKAQDAVNILRAARPQVDTFGDQGKFQAIDIGLNLTQQKAV